MDTRIYVDGRITRPEDAVVGVLDYGFLFGDSVYEVLWWHRGVLIQEREHLDRLEASAARLYMDIQQTREDLVTAMHETARPFSLAGSNRIADTTSPIARSSAS